MASDQRMVGHAIRRRQGSAASHLGQAEGEAKQNGTWKPPSGGLSAAESTARQEEDVVRGGGRSRGVSHIKGVPDVYPTGTATMGRGTSARSLLSRDPAAFASGVSAGRETEPHPPRPQAPEAEAATARLTVSPSMKIPTESPVPTQGGGMAVPSISSRTRSFQSGMEETRER